MPFSRRSANEQTPESPFKTPDRTKQVNTAFGFVTIDELRGIRKKTEANEKPDAVIISQEDLNEIKNRMKFQSPD